MNKQLRVSFAPGMPPAVLELYGPDFRPLDSFMLSGGGSNEITAPPPESFLRIHLPSGRIITIPNAERLDREITPAMFEHHVRGRTELQAELYDVTGESPPRPPYHQSDEVAAAVYDTTPTRLRGSVGAPSWQWIVSGARPPRGPMAWSFAIPTKEPRELIGTYGPMTIRMRLPGNITSVEIVSDPAAMDPDAQRVLLRTSNEEADYALTRLHQASIFAVREMLEWAHRFIRNQHRDPYTAAVAGYLLLRIGRTDILAAWSAKLCEAAPSLPDGSILHAWVALSGEYGNGAKYTEEARKGLLQAMKCGIPLYVEGLRLLFEGLRLTHATEELDQFESNLGMVMWAMPLTTCITLSKRMNRVPPISSEFQSLL